MPSKTHYEVTVIANGAVTMRSFPTAKLAAYATLLAYRAVADDPEKCTEYDFMLNCRTISCAWSNRTRTAHVEVVKVRAVSAPIAERMMG